MSASRFMIVGFVICVLATPALAKPASSPGPKQQFQAIYGQIDNSLRQKDYNKFISFYDSQFIEHGANQPVEYFAEFSQGWQRDLQIMHFMNPVTRIDSIKPWGHGVLVHIQMRETYECPDDGNQRVLLHMIDQEADEDYWIKRNGVWKMREEIELSGQLWENGHQID